MEISENNIDDVTIVTICTDRIDAGLSLDFRKKIIDVVDRARRKIVLDMSEVEVIDSSGLGAVIAALKRHGNTETFVVSGMQIAVKRLFRLTRMDRVFKIVDTTDDGLTFLSNDLSNRFQS